MENQNKYLLLARRARAEDNAEDAAKYYDMVRTEDPDNAEAKFFYSYYRMFSDTKGHAYGNFVSLCNGVAHTIEMVMASDDSDEDKKSFIEIVFICIREAMLSAWRADLDIHGGNLTGLHSTYFETIKTIAEMHANSYGENEYFMAEVYDAQSNLLHIPSKLYDLADEIETKYPSNSELMETAVKIWKKGIDLHQEYQYFPWDEKEKSRNADVAKYAAKIRKYEQTYVTPKKAGCIKFV